MAAFRVPRGARPLRRARRRLPSSAGNDEPGVVVTDVPSAPPAPTSKDQCKRGGWAAFGFKNQGQCVAFVNRGPKPH